jgi:two-component system chemotaxis response regulator CheY
MGFMRVLVIDDDETILRTVRRALGERGYDVLQAENGRAGLGVLAEMVELPLVLLDWWMPVMNGEDFLCSLEMDPRFAALNVAIMSSDPQAAMQYSRAYLPKPFTIDMLLNVLGRLSRGCWPQPYRMPGGFW